VLDEDPQQAHVVWLLSWNQSPHVCELLPWNLQACGWNFLDYHAHSRKGWSTCPAATLRSSWDGDFQEQSQAPHLTNRWKGGGGRVFLGIGFLVGVTAGKKSD